MAERVRVVAGRSSRSEAAKKEFAFSEADIRSGDLRDMRLHAWDVFQRMELPEKSDEAWRRTDLRSLPVDSFQLPAEGAYEDLPSVPVELLQPVDSDRHSGEVLLLPGGAQSDLDPIVEKQGVVFTDLATAEEHHSGVLKQIVGQIVKPEESKFAALTASLAQNGLLLYVPKGVSIEEPFHSISWGPGSGLAHISHLLVYLDDGASATYIHESASPDENGHALSAGITEILIGEGANLQFVELQSWGKQVWNFNHERIHVGKQGSLDWTFGSLGSRLTKHFMTVDLVGEGASGCVSGFYFSDGNQHLDHDTRQNHRAVHTSSDLLFKGALKGHSRSVWRGMVYVAPGAEKSDGYQSNRNLILSPQARADSIPGLEILADDVRCTHGATVGQLEQEALFYLKSRGIPQADAEQMLVEGFFDPLVQRVPFEGVRARFQQAIRAKLSK